MEDKLIKLKHRKYWYIKEIETCVLCGREKIRKYRVYEKPKMPIVTIEYACYEHFT